MAQSFNLKAIISAVDKVSGPMRKINAALRSPMKAVRDVVNSTSGLGSQIAGSLGPLGALAGAGGLAGIGMGVGGVVKTSAQFEKFRTILETVEGSAAKAKASMAWVSDFAAKTPYELAEVTEGFVKLKAYGIDPQSGALRAAGDAAASLGKGLNDAVEALADAMTGESERLKEFGITASTAGDMITYRWQQNGKDMVARVDKNNKELIRKTITGIWNDRYGGAMDKLSGTWDGMWSNMMDGISRFTLAVGEAGAFDYLKSQLAELLEFMETPAFKKLATDIGTHLTAALKEVRATLAAVDWRGAWERVEAFGAAVMAGVRWVGGFGNAALILAGILAAPLVASLLQVVTAFGRLGLALGGLVVKMAIMPVVATFTAAMAAARWAVAAFNVALSANPVGAVIMAVMALAAAAYGIYANWGPISDWFARMWDSVKAVFAGVVDFVAGVFTGDFDRALAGVKAIGQGLLDWFLGWGDAVLGIVGSVVQSLTGFDLAGMIRGKLRDMAALLPGWVTDKLGIDVSATAAPVQQALGEPPAAAAANDDQPLTAATRPSLVREVQRLRLEGEMVVRFENAPPGMRAAEGRSNQPGVAFNPDVGYRKAAMGMP